MVDWEATLQRLLTERITLFLAILVLLLGLLAAALTIRALRRLFGTLGLSDAVEGTPFERSVQRFGTSTVSLIAWLGGLFVLATAVLVAFRLLGFTSTELLVTRVADYVPRVLVATVVIILGLVLGDKAALATRERLSQLKLAEIGILPTVVKYSIFYVAALVALAQLGVATTALVVLLAVFAFGLVFLGGVAFRDLLAAGAAGVYLILNQPYTIGDEVRIDGHRGIVQEVDVFATRIENDGEEFILPNHHLFRGGVVRIREES